jgi:hypothetical protein
MCVVATFWDELSSALTVEQEHALVPTFAAVVMDMIGRDLRMIVLGSTEHGDCLVDVRT